MIASTPFWRSPVTLVWLLLATGTGASWWIGACSGGATEAQHALASVGLLTLAAIKVRLVIFHFMEVRTAPLALRLLCDAWLAIVVGGLLLTVRATGMR